MSHSSFAFNRSTFTDQAQFVQSGCRCCTPVPSDYQVDREARRLRSYRASTTREVTEATVPVQFIHITSGNDGVVSESRRQQQIDVLNQDFAPHGIQFEYDPRTVVVVDRPDWFFLAPDSREERAAKMALHVDPERTLNFYTAGLDAGLLGWATFPFDLAGDPAMDGVVLLHESLPGGSAAPYNLGRTATHEVGHWLGLYHTFEPRGTCDLIDDRVVDTVAHRNPDFGTPAPGVYSSCDGESMSPVKNYMNYTDDAWMDRFSEGQGVRMREQIGLYRPSLAEPNPGVPVDVEELVLAASGSGTLHASEDSRLFVVELPGAATVALDGPGGVDFDLYIRRDTPPTTEEYDQRGYTSSADETLEVDSPGRYFILARSYRGAGNFSLAVTLNSAESSSRVHDLDTSLETT